MSTRFVKCQIKTPAIKGSVFVVRAALASHIAQGVTNGSIGLSLTADTAAKVGDVVTQISDPFSEFCTPGGNAELGGGACDGLDRAALPNCLEQRVGPWKLARIQPAVGRRQPRETGLTAARGPTIDAA